MRRCGGTRVFLYTSCVPGSRAPFCAALIITPHCLHTNREILRIAYPQYLPVLLSSESASLAPSLPLSAASGHKRYNTLDFASKIVCQQGAARPYWKPRAKGRGLPVATAAAGSSADRAGRRDLRPFGYPIIFSQMVPTLKKSIFQCLPFSRKCRSTRPPFLQELCKNLACAVV